jgi:hypothetical protein
MSKFTARFVLDSRSRRRAEHHHHGEAGDQAPYGGGYGGRCGGFPASADCADRNAERLGDNFTVGRVSLDAIADVQRLSVAGCLADQGKVKGPLTAPTLRWPRAGRLA